MGVRVLAIDRPGFGHSTRRPGRSLRLVADDLAYLLDALELEVVPVVAHSAGGPHALAMAACHGERVSRMSVVSGACRLNSDERAGVVKANQEVAAAAERGWDALHRYLVDLRKELLRGETPALLADVVESDLVVIGDLNRNVRERQVRDEGLRQGAEGWADEVLAIMGDWDFDLSAVQAHVTWFHGADDNTVPISAARRLAQRLPNCELIELEARGHRTAVGRRAIEDVLTA
jgi:pimeloyl-ACP methyl ester carboxylesterase